MNRLSEFAQNPGGHKAKALSEVANLEVTVEGFTLQNGRYGEIAIMTVTLEGGERERVITGSKVVIDALKKASEAKAFPAKAIFRKRGQSWQIE